VRRVDYKNEKLKMLFFVDTKFKGIAIKSLLRCRHYINCGNNSLTVNVNVKSVIAVICA
jgi:hypothetical protein